MTKNKFLETYFYLFCWLCIVTGALLRLVFWAVPLTYDEIYSVVAANPAYSLGYIVKNFLLPDVHPPLYNILLYYWNHIFTSMTEIMVRTPSLICSFGALAAAWVYFPKGKSSAQKHIFVTLMAVSYLPVYYAADTRSYSLMFLLSVLLTFFSLDLGKKLTEKKEIKTSLFVIYSLLSVLMTYTHYFAAIIAGVYFIILAAYALKEKRYFLPFCLAYGAAVLAAAPWLCAQGAHNLRVISQGTWWGSTIPLSDALGNIITQTLSGYLTVILIAATVLYALFHITKKEKKVLLSFDILFPLLSIILVFAVCFVLRVKLSFFIERFFMALLPAAFLLVSFFMARAMQKKTFFYLAGIIIFSSALYYTAQQVLVTGKDNIYSKGITQHILDTYPQQNKYFYYAKDFYPAAAQDAVFSYYLEKLGEKNYQMFNIIFPEVLQDYRANHPNNIIWVPTCHLWELPRHEIVERKDFSCLIKLK